MGATTTYRAPQATNDAMISPAADHLMIGGASILVLMLYWFFVDAGANKSGVVEAAFWLTFVVNSPHFLASYQLLYADNRQHLFKKPSFFWAAFVAPVLILAVLGWGAFTANTRLLGLLAQGMYLSVGWHYVKQIFGTAIVASAIQKRYFGVFERNFILLNLYSLWAGSWVSINLKKTASTLDGITFFTLDLPDSMLTIAYGAVAVTFILALAAGVKKYIETGVRPATSSLVSFAAIYVWFIPGFYHPHFSVLIPFFHSLQYLLFVIAMKKNQAVSESAKLSLDTEKRSEFMKTFWGFLLLAAILGALTFEFVPKGLDKNFPFAAIVLGKSFWLFSFAIFVNIHHYFIDNVIWRGDNEMLKTHLVLASQRAGAK